jgi:hypothetical protein
MLSVEAQVKSPEQFLGYAPGSQYTPHWKIVNYFTHVASAMPGRVKLEKIGETYEGRPLYLAYLSTASNMTRLDDIRKNNLRIAGVLNDQPATDNNTAIVWLSYNVHGNEPSSSEAAMVTLYELLTRSEAQTWLQNTVVIIDPCLNPDGRDRYVNWFNSVRSKIPDPHPATREHIEPWPGGRPNHYNFDMNRDWAWQSQTETRSRIAKYLQWLPQIHCDYHEQGFNEPYYFAPAAEPFHEVITPWQRDFQTTIGKNHARYFDAKGWLYFTKERFDLFYPSYGDTYPTYYGSIGMTYEQGGHSRGGLAVQTEDGDTLTLTDRVTHHHTTGMSTVEIASQNAGKLVQNFKRFYADAIAGAIGEYKTYLLRNIGNGRTRALLQLLDKNQIRYQYAKAGTATGYNYFTGKSETFTVNTGDVLISAYQPHAAMVKVLFEPKSRLADSATYDITAWSLPYAYGIQCWGLALRVPGTDEAPAIPAPVVNREAYAYLIDWKSMQSAYVLSELLQKGVKVRFSEKLIVQNGKEYQPGTLIVIRPQNKHLGNLDKLVEEVAARHGVELTSINSGFVDKGTDFGSPDVKSLTAPRIACLTGEGVSSTAAGEVWYLFEQQLNYPLSLINARDLRQETLGKYDVLILPDGNYRFLNDKESSAGLRTWIQQGGKLIAMEGTVSQLAANDWGPKLKKQDGEDRGDAKKGDYSALHRYEHREREGISGYIPGAIYKVELDNSHPLAFGYGNQYFTLKLDDYIYEFMKDGWNVGVIRKDQLTAGFAGFRVKDRLQDGTLFAVQEMGAGSVVYLADNPLFRNFWEGGKLLFANAVFMVGH